MSFFKKCSLKFHDVGLRFSSQFQCLFSSLAAVTPPPSQSITNSKVTCLPRGWRRRVTGIDPYLSPLLTTPPPRVIDTTHFGSTSHAALQKFIASDDDDGDHDAWGVKKSIGRLSPKNLILARKFTPIDGTPSAIRWICVSHLERESSSPS